MCSTYHPLTSTDCQQPAVTNDALAEARAAMRAERARQARAMAWTILYYIYESNDEAVVAAWMAERQRYVLEAERLERGE